MDVVSSCSGALSNRRAVSTLDSAHDAERDLEKDWDFLSKSPFFLC